MLRCRTLICYIYIYIYISSHFIISHFFLKFQRMTYQSNDRLEAEEEYMQHCREYCKMYPSDRFTFEEQLMRLWHSTRERMGFMAYRQEKRKFLNL
jgi:hypothetical protein